MSTSDHRSRPCTYSRAQTRKRKAVLDVDLNVVPPVDNRDQVGPSTCSRSQQREANQVVAPLITAPIDLEAFDDDVIISSPRAFAAAWAKNNSRRNHDRQIVVDVDSEEQSSRVSQNGQNKRRRIPPSPTVLEYDVLINLEAACNSELYVTSPPPPPKELTFNCPVCMGPLVEEMSTKCGHIFCKKCIKAAISAQNKCPTCRRRVTMKDVFRVYLPAAS